MAADDLAALLAASIHRALATPEHYLAAALAGLSDEALAAEIAADPRRVCELRLCSPPRVAYWAHDVRILAEFVGAEPVRLEALLRRVGVRP